MFPGLRIRTYGEGFGIDVVRNIYATQSPTVPIGVKKVTDLSEQLSLLLFVYDAFKFSLCVLY
jgi:hypothetical protein